MDGIILVNKPQGMTSHDVVNKLRKILKTKKVGHCGTLDPDATGLLVVCINKATKALQFLMADNKNYQATLLLGKSTDTYDLEGKVTKEKEFTGVDKQEVIQVLNSFLGPQKQVPPIYSAIKVNGKKLYEYARNNEEVVIEPRNITIHDIKLVDIRDNEIIFDVVCSKGTYIRSLCVDIADKLNYPGLMSNLNRVQSGVFNINDSSTLEEIENGTYKLISVDEALSDYQKIIVDDVNIVYHGKKIPSDIQEVVAVCDRNEHILAMYGPDGQGNLKNIRGLW